MTEVSLPHNDKRNIEDYYELEKKIGVGSSSNVYLATHKETKVKYAVKVIDKKLISIAQFERIHGEIEILRNIQHPNIINMVDHFENTNKLYLVMELKTGGELFDRIVAKGRFNEDEAVLLLRQICQCCFLLTSEKHCSSRSQTRKYHVFWSS